MNNTFEDILQEGINKCLIEKGIVREKANTKQLGKAFTEFYFNEIGQYLFPIDEDTIYDGLECDGSGDLNIDFAFEKENQYFIFQFKYKGKNARVTTDELAGFFGICNRINDETYFDKHANNSLKDLLRNLSPENPIQFYFVTNDKVSTTINDEFQLQKEIKENQFDHYSFELKNISDLKTDYKVVSSESQTVTDEVLVHIESIHDSFSNDHKLSYLDLTSVIDPTSTYKTILCTITGNSLKSLWGQHKSRLFNYNIRGYLGENPINKKIKETIDTEPNRFYFYNNGISAICTEIIPIQNSKNIITTFRCLNFQIINGAQTTTTIGKYKDRDKNNLSKVRVLLRITKAEDYKKEKGLNKKIVAYNNSQTIIKAGDFRSNDDIQVFLEQKLTDYKYKSSIPHKTVIYLRKRIKQEKKKDRLLIPMDTMARALYVFENDPLLVYKGARYFFDTDEENGQYWRIFGDNGRELEFYNDARVTKTIGIYFLWTRIEEKLKALAKQYKSEGKSNTIPYQALLAKWHFLYMYGNLLTNYYESQLPAILKKIANGSIFEKPDNFIEKWFTRIHKLITKCIEQNYQQFEEGENKDIAQGFNFKNWIRSSSEFDKLKREIKYLEITDYQL